MTWIWPSDWLGVRLDHGVALLWKGTRGLNPFLLETHHSVTGEPHSSSLESKFLLCEHEPLGQMGI